MYGFMMYEANAEDVLEFARIWTRLGQRITEQVVTLIEDPDTEDVDRATIQKAHRALSPINEQIGDALAEYLDATK